MFLGPTLNESKECEKKTISGHQWLKNSDSVVWAILGPKLTIFVLFGPIRVCKKQADNDGSLDFQIDMQI